jgi:ABC-type transporter Mla maintaining outer membrane lipid asymmetry ATPase subunit MlaF
MACIYRGELVSCVGPSGCGKTTLLRLIGGFLHPNAGSVVLDGEDITTVDVGGTRLIVDRYDPRHARAFQPGDAVTLVLPDDPHILPESGDRNGKTTEG